MMTTTATTTITENRRIRDETDRFLEENGLYRKHVAKGSDSIFRTVSDFLYSTQKYFYVVRKAYDEFHKKNSCRQSHRVLYALSEIFDVEFQVLDSSSSSSFGLSETISIKSDDEEFRKEVLFVCFKAPNQYEPIYSKEKIENFGISQSLLYELLYEKVFRLAESMEAANKMIYGVFEAKKPGIYDKEFKGTAMEALKQNLIPFPYKIAKALDPGQYRNIEYDVWISSIRQSSSNNKIISGGDGGLHRGFVCKYLNYWGHIEIGEFVSFTVDKERAEIRSWPDGASVFVPRQHVEAITDPDTVFTFKAFMLHVEETRRRQQRNLFLSSRGDDSHWLDKFDFSVPPPPPPRYQKLPETSIYPIIGYPPQTLLSLSPTISSDSGIHSSPEEVIEQQDLATINTPTLSPIQQPCCYLTPPGNGIAVVPWTTTIATPSFPSPPVPVFISD